MRTPGESGGRAPPCSNDGSPRAYISQRTMSQELALGTIMAKHLKVTMIKYKSLLYCNILRYGLQRESQCATMPPGSRQKKTAR